MVGHLFTILILASCAYACIAGGKEGRWVSILLIGAAFLSLAASRIGYRWSQVNVLVVAVDLLLLFSLVTVAIKSKRFWPIWTTAFHLLSISSHVARAIGPALPPKLYFALQGLWSLPAILVMVGGIMWDRRAGLPAKAAWKPLFDDPSKACPGSGKAD